MSREFQNSFPAASRQSVESPDGSRAGGRYGAIQPPGYLFLKCGWRQWYRDRMCAKGEPGPKGLPVAIPADELQKMLGASDMFCSWDASHSMRSKLTARWPFLFSRPLLGTNKKPKK